MIPSASTSVLRLRSGIAGSHVTMRPTHKAIDSLTSGLPLRTDHRDAPRPGFLIREI